VNRRRFCTSVIAATAAVTLALAAMPTAAEARSGPRSKRVCAAARRHHVACNARVVTDRGLRPHATITPQGGFTPAQLRTAYGLTGDAHGTIAIVDAYANPRAEADLGVYRSRFGLPPAVLTQVNESGGATLPKGNISWGQEEMLDLEMASAICPGCPLLYVAAASTSLDDFGAAVDTAARLGATVVSNSYGGAEFAGEAAFASHYDHPGVAIVASSGDSGYGAQVPAVFGTVTAAGGTTLHVTANGTRAGETVWSGAGSGCSAYIAKPAWQHDTACPRRTVADVAAVADPATGVAVYDSYGSRGGADWFVFGGTSVAAPIVAGVYALSGDTSGVPASRSYTAPAGSLFDVQSGSNGRCVTRSKPDAGYLCTGGSGYDGPTGNGTPNGTGAF
jgi:subtilase family serine protease